MDEFRQVQSELTKPGVKGWWDRLNISDKQRADLEAAADDPTITHKAIAIVLERWGMTVTPTQVGHWRRNVRKGLS